MKRLLILLCLSAFSSPAPADVYSTALQRARDVANQNNARQGVSPPPPAPAPPAANPQPDPVLAATLQNILNLQADFVNLEADPARRQTLISDLNAAAPAVQTSTNLVSKLAADLATALGGKHFPQAQLKKLATDVHALFNGSHLSPAQQRTVSDDVQKVLQSGDVSSDDAAKVVNDLKAIAAAAK